MPNWVTNTINVKGNAAAVEEMLGAIRSEASPLDFNRISPMPEELGDAREAGDNHAAILQYLSGGRGTAGGMGRGAKALLMEILKAEGRDAEKTIAMLKDHWPDRYGKLYSEGRVLVENYLKYGATTWYRWCISHWGTKWNAVDAYAAPCPGGAEICFSTAWSPVPGIVLAISRAFPALLLEYAYEDGEECGEELIIKRGRVISRRELPPEHM